MIKTTATIRGTKHIKKIWVELSDEEAWEVARVVIRELIKKWDGEISDLEKEKARLTTEMNQIECKERMAKELGFVFP